MNPLSTVIVAVLIVLIFVMTNVKNGMVFLLLIWGLNVLTVKIACMQTNLVLVMIAICKKRIIALKRLILG